MIFPYKTTQFLLTFLIGASLGACSAPVKEIDYAPTPHIPEQAAPTPIKFSGLKLLLPPGMKLGNHTSGMFCTTPAYPINRNVLKKEIDATFLRQNFHDALESNGYDVVGSLDILFDPEDEEQRAEYSIAGKLKDVQLDLCNTTLGNLSPFSSKTGEHGKMYLAIDWSVYDRLKRHVIYKTRTEGYTKRTIPNTEGISLLFHDAFEMAAHNLAADEQFRALIIDGVKPPNTKKNRDMRGEKIDRRPRLFDADESVSIAPLPLSRHPFAKTAKEGQKITVMLQKGGHGSGFFITKEGHLLTNAHVIGEARRMRLVTANKKHKLIAEVLRVNRARDVALLKLENIPENLKITPLPLRLDWPAVGEDVYAIGTPKSYSKMQGTLTKGIISAHRKNFKHDGIRLNFIQSDVEIHGGNSGGPLFDEYGNITGLSVLAVAPSEGGIGNGLNLFIPLREALDVLGISY